MAQCGLEKTFYKLFLKSGMLKPKANVERQFMMMCQNPKHFQKATFCENVVRLRTIARQLKAHRATNRELIYIKKYTPNF